MRRSVSWFQAVFATLLIFGLPDLAQAEIEIPLTSLPAVFHQLPPAIQRNLLKEAEVAGEDCADNMVLSVYQDCTCRAVKFVEARLVEGPDISINTLQNKISTSCPNPKAITAHQARQCVELMNAAASYDPDELNTFCGCLGETVARMYTDEPSNNSRYFTELYTEAGTECGRDVLRRR